MTPLSLHLDIPPLRRPLNHQSRILLVGSCFTRHISERLELYKLGVLSNPHGILFNPLSVASSLSAYVSKRKYSEEELFYLNEIWNSWDHHTQFSDVDCKKALEKINLSQLRAASFLKSATHIIITLGSAFQYFLKATGQPVANNHRAPAQWFEKKLLEIVDIKEVLRSAMEEVRTINPQADFLFTISPVRHIRDGVIENNRSKARLLEVVHDLCSSTRDTYYFPAYELVIDILRDYRFYDLDLVHPNFLATQLVWERFLASCLSPDSQDIVKELEELKRAIGHTPRFPETTAHKNFVERNLRNIERLETQYPYLDFEKERQHFTVTKTK